MSMGDIAEIPSGRLPGLSPADRAWVAGLDPGTMTSMEAGRLRALAHRAEPGDKPACLARLAEFEEGHPRPVQTAQPGSVADTAGAAIGRAEREAREAAEVARQAPIDGLPTMAGRYGATQEAGQ